MSIRLGIIGTGRIARRAVAEIRAVDGIEISIVANPNPVHAQEFAKKNGVKKYISDIDELSGRVDAVYIASPHGTHYDYSVNLLNKGIHVICEKPAFFDCEQALAIRNIASQNGLVFMEGIKTAYCPGFMQIEDIVASGKIGAAVDVEAAFTRLTPAGGREYADKKYGGSFTEFGTYAMLPILRFLGTEGFGVSFMHRDEDDVDVYTKAVFDYGDRFGCAKTGLSVKSEGQLVIAGTGGYILVPSPWWLTRYFEVRYEDPSRIERHECDFNGDGLRYEFAEFLKRIDEGVSIPINEAEEMKARAGVYEEFLKNERTEFSS